MGPQPSESVLMPEPAPPPLTTAVEPMHGLKSSPGCWAHSRLVVRSTPFSKHLNDKLNYLLVFSVLRAYALSNRNVYLAAVIILLALAPSVMAIVSVPNIAPARDD